MFTEEANLKIIDFGTAKEVKNELMETRTGTPIYMAPETYFKNGSFAT